MAELYQKGIVSLQEAATQAKLSLYEIMEYVQKEDIHPPDQTKEEVLIEIEKSKEFDSIYNVKYYSSSFLVVEKK
ncbi:hypothetical protein LCGC14_1846680 [marine sediment metagenome]|uniref:Uncharacterized protein n=2 Tax=marine sediment metagenome TaxID=412755 RepID=A0A0F9GZT4_9ZZZZ